MCLVTPQLLPKIPHTAFWTAFSGRPAKVAMFQWSLVGVNAVAVPSFNSILNYPSKCLRGEQTQLQLLTMQLSICSYMKYGKYSNSKVTWLFNSEKAQTLQKKNVKHHRLNIIFIWKRIHAIRYVDRFFNNACWGKKKVEFYPGEYKKKKSKLLLGKTNEEFTSDCIKKKKFPY